MTEKATGLARLREPFEAHQISKLPKGNVMLSYVGHAALTDRLLDVDPLWTWEPVSTPEALGLPVAPNGMWIRLTVCGVTRLGYGDAGAKKGGDAVKEIIGDALRNAAMRFGAALDLWHKGDLHKDEDETPATPAPTPDGYDDWRMDFLATAETGLKVMTAAWKETPEAYRTHWTATEPKSSRDALRKLAQSVDANQ